MQHSYSVSLIKELIAHVGSKFDQGTDWKSARQGKKPQKLKNNNNKRDFPGGPVVETVCSQCRRDSLILFSLVGKVRSHLPHNVTLKQKRKKESRLFPGLFVYLFYFWLCWSFGLCCFYAAFSTWGEQGLLFIVVCGLLILVTSLVAEHRL